MNRILLKIKLVDCIQKSFYLRDWILILSRTSPNIMMPKTRKGFHNQQEKVKRHCVFLPKPFLPLYITHPQENHSY